MIIKNHNIELNDTSASEMARFRQIMLNIWRQQIEDDRNANEMEKFIKASYKKNIDLNKKYANNKLGEVILNSDIRYLNYINDSKQKNFNSLEDKFVDRIVYVNGHFYNEDGTFEGKINDLTNDGSVEDVYTCTGKSVQKIKMEKIF